MLSVYKQCPILENDLYQLRLVEMKDANDLLKVYSDKLAVPIFNSDNCHGDTFYYTTIERMKEAIAYWIMEYKRSGFVRWSIVDKNKKEVIGMIELFQRNASDYFNACGLLRLDLRSDYEYENYIVDILSLILPKTFAMFDCEIIATKAVALAEERINALKKMDLKLSHASLVGHDRTEYKDYWVIHKKA